MLACSFCGLEAGSTDALLAGPGVNICGNCVAVGVRAIATRDALEQPDLAPGDWDNSGDEALLSEMAATSQLVDKIRNRLQSQVETLRRRGISWTVIGTALGVSHQIAQERFG